MRNTSRHLPVARSGISALSQSAVGERDRTFDSARYGHVNNCAHCRHLLDRSAGILVAHGVIWPNLSVVPLRHGAAPVAIKAPVKELESTFVLTLNRSVRSTSQ
jgi:hypothetical protein